MADQQPIQFEKGWQTIESNFSNFCGFLDKLYNGEVITNTKIITTKDYSQIYTLVYNMCTQKEPNCNSQLYENITILIKEYLNKNVVPNLKNKKQKEILIELDKRWTNHLLMKKWIERLCDYLNRFHVQHNGLLKLDKLALNLFARNAFDLAKLNIFEAFIEELDNIRKKQESSRSLLKNITKIFLELNTDSVNIYKEFEGYLLAKSNDFYVQKNQEWGALSCAEYLTNTETLLHEEERTLEDVLFGNSSQQTIKSTMSAFDDKIIRAYKRSLVERTTGLAYMINNEQFDDLSRVFRLFGRLNDNFDLLAQTFKDFVYERGLEIINEKKKQLEEAGDKKENSQDPLFVKSLITFYEKYHQILEKCFPGDIYFRQAFRDALEKALNQKMKITAAEYIASYTNNLLKKNQGAEKLSDEERDFSLEKIVGLFSCVSDKDLFLDMYRHLLAQRLLQDKSESDADEKEMISKLKITCGAQHTSRLEGMINDMEMALEINKNFQDWCKSYEKEKFPETHVKQKVRVLSKSHWPTFKNSNMVLPIEITKSQAAFNLFYSKLNQFRSLEFMYPLCTVTVDSTFASGKVEITMTLCQYVILKFFEKTAGATFKELMADLNFDEETLKKNLHSLCFTKFVFLEKQPNTKTFNYDDVFVFQNGFKSQRMKISLPTPNLEETYQRARVEEDRGLAIEAAIVRVMKSRKTLTYQLLIQEVLTILRQFRPDPKMIKVKIETLIEKDFIERDKDDNTLLKYMA